MIQPVVSSGIHPSASVWPPPPGRQKSGESHHGHLAMAIVLVYNGPVVKDLIGSCAIYFWLSQNLHPDVSNPV